MFIKRKEIPMGSVRQKNNNSRKHPLNVISSGQSKKIADTVVLNPVTV